MRKRLCLVCILTVAIANPVSAHALKVRWSFTGDIVQITARYDDGTPAGEATVKAMDADKQVVAEGKIDSAGAWSFRPPKPGRYRVVVDDGMGHREEVWVGEGLEPAPEESAGAFWFKAAIGLAAIVGFCLALWYALRRKKTRL